MITTGFIILPDHYQHLSVSLSLFLWGPMARLLVSGSEIWRESILPLAIPSFLSDSRCVLAALQRLARAWCGCCVLGWIMGTAARGPQKQRDGCAAGSRIKGKGWGRGEGREGNSKVHNAKCWCVCFPSLLFRAMRRGKITWKTNNGCDVLHTVLFISKRRAITSQWKYEN